MHVLARRRRRSAATVVTGAVVAATATSLAVPAACAEEPVLDAGTWAGSSGDEFTHALAIAPDGSIYVAGYTTSPDLPGALNSMTGDLDGFVMKLSADLGALHWSFFIGGSGTFEFPTDCAASADGGVVVTGRTDSADFPTVDALDPTLDGPSDAFLLKLDADGTMVFSTYLGGSGGENGEGDGFSKILGEVEVATDGTILVAGTTHSDDFPLVDPIDSTFGGFNSDVFVARISADGQAILASTYLGDRFEDEVWGMQLDAANRVVIVGNAGPEWPQTPGAYSFGTPSSSGVCYVTSLEADARSINWSSRIDRVDRSGGGLDYRDVAVAPDGSVVAAGRATGGGFPVPPTAWQPEYTDGQSVREAIALVYAADGSDIIGGTFIGTGITSEDARTVAVDSAGRVLITSRGTELRVFNPSMTEVEVEAFELAPSGTMWDLHADAQDDVLATMITLEGPTTPGAFQEVNPGGETSFLVRWDLPPHGPAPLPGDLDGDGQVGFPDLSMLLAAWGECPRGAECPADLDGNGTVGFGDLAAILAAWD